MAVTYVATGLGAGGNSSFNSATRASAPMAMILPFTCSACNELARTDQDPTLTAGPGQFNHAEPLAKAIKQEAVQTCGARSAHGPSPELDSAVTMFEQVYLTTDH